MKIPEGAKILAALFAWAEMVGFNHNDAKSKACAANVKGATAGWRNWRRGESISTLLVDLAKVCDAFQFTDIDCLLDFVNALEGPAEPLIIRAADREEEPYEKGRKETYRAQITSDRWAALKASGQLDHHRTMIDRVIIAPAQATSIRRHLGHETVMVMRGKVRFQLNQKAWELEQYDCICFNSLTSHTVSNIGTIEAELVVAQTLLAAEYDGRLNRGGELELFMNSAVKQKKKRSENLQRTDSDDLNRPATNK